MPYCFRCGSATHDTHACSVKRLDDLVDMQSKTANAVERLGHSSWDQVDTLIREQDRLVEAQERATDRIAGAISRKTDAIYELSTTVETSINQVTEALYGLSNQFRQAHDEAMWKAEQQIHLLTGIHNMIANPRGTEAEELLRMGRESLEVGMVDETLNLLKESVGKNPLDYRTYVTMGYAYIEKNEPESALDRFEYALRNSRTEGYRTRALLLIARAKYIMEDFAGAIQAARASVNTSPDYSEAHYRLAGYYAANGEADASIRCLQYLIEGGKTIAGNTIEADRSYFVKAQIDPEFSNSRDEINVFLQKLLRKERELAEKAMQNAQIAIEKAQEWHVDWSFANSKFAEAKRQFETQSYFGYQDAQPPAREAEINANGTRLKQQRRMRADAENVIKGAQNKINNVESGLQNLIEPQKQLETPYNPNEHFQTAEDKLVEAQSCFDLDTYSGYLQAQEDAKEVQEIAVEIGSHIVEFQKLQNNAQASINNAESVLHDIEEASEQQVAPEKFQTAQEKLTKARESFELRTKSGYSRAHEAAGQVEILANEIRELRQLREKAQGPMRNAENALQKFHSEKKAKYMRGELEEVEKKLGEVRNKFELNTPQGYINAAEIAKEVNSSEIRELTRLASQRESEHCEKVSKLRKSIIYGILFGAVFGFAGFIVGALGAVGYHETMLVIGKSIGAIIGFLSGFALGWRLGKD